MTQAHCFDIWVYLSLSGWINQNHVQVKGFISIEASIRLIFLTFGTIKTF